MKKAVVIAILLCFVSAFTVAAERSATVKPKKKAGSSSQVSDHYHALIIGNNNYKHLHKLKTAVADATEVEKILKVRYGFKTKLLLTLMTLMRGS